MLLASANILSNKNYLATATLGAVSTDNSDTIFIVGGLLAIEGELIAGMCFCNVGNLETADLVITVPF